MKSSNLRAHAVFLTILLVFCYFVGQSATTDINNLPESVIELLSGKTTDFTGVANQIPEHRLPTALAAAKLLKFRALHGETSLSSNEAEAFETILLDRMSTARQVAFSQNETCRKKIEQHEIMFDGQKLLVPAHFVADAALAIIDCRPKGEAGSLFPDFSIEVFSQTQLTEVTLAINGQTVNTKNILIKQSANAFELSYRTPATPDSLLAIGTHTAEITINNQAGETTKQEWLFTVGVHDTSTLPLTADAVIISEIDLPLEKILPGIKTLGQLTVVVYQNAAGTRFTEYGFKTATGQTITSQNLAFIARKITAGRDDIDKLSFSPQTHYAFAGNLLNFSYIYSGSGDVISEKWLVSSGGHSTTEPVITMNGGAVAECTITVQKKSTNSAGEEVVYQYDVVGIKYVSQVKFRKIDIYSADPHLQHAASCSFAIENTVISNISDVALVEGEQYPVSFDKTEGSSNAGVLTVDKLSWHIHASEGSPKIENPSATSTRLISNAPGCAELVLDIKLTWQEAGETYTSDFKPSVSALFANYPITAKAEFNKYPPGIIYLTSRHIALKSFEFSIKDQKRLIANPEDCELANPILICQSSLWPASAPITINKVLPMLSHGSKKEWLEEVSPFTFQTPEAEENVSEIPLCLGGHFQAAGYFTDKVIISDLPSVPIFSWEDNLLSLNLDPAGPVTTYEGAVTTFSAEVEPSPEMGSGILSATDNTLDLLDGYKVESVVGIGWYEAPLDSGDDWKTKAVSGQDYSHIFNPEDGPGSYTMNCTALMKMQESDTADSFMISAQNNAPVDLLPGLRIFSPINELAYPVNVSLKVKTSFDEDPKIWKAIQWRLNGKEYHHGLEKPPFFIELNRPGKWSLVASLTVENPQDGEDISLQDRVDFVVNPVDITLTPTRKVFDLSKQKSQELSLNITLNGKKVEKPGKPVEWGDDGLKAVVDPIEWFSATAPNGCATANHDEDSLAASIGFTDAGAATVLATVTVRLTDGEEYFRRRHKGFEDEFEEPIFTFPAVRADLWAVSAGPLKEVKGLFPEKAIALAYRTYQIESFEFDFHHKQRQLEKYSLEEGLKPPIVIGPALAGGASVSASINFAWEVISDTKIEKEVEAPTKLVIKPSAPCDYQVVVEPMLDFGSAGKIQLGKIETAAKAVSLFDLIETKVDPASFTITLGATKTLRYIVRSLETDYSSDEGDGSSGQSGSVIVYEEGPDSNVIYLLDKSFALTIDRVLWSYEQDSPTPDPVKNSIEGRPFVFQANTLGNVKGQASGFLKLSELRSDLVANYTVDTTWLAFVKSLIVQILVNGRPIGSQQFYMGQKIQLSYKAVSGSENDSSNVVFPSVKWHLPKPLIRESVTSSYPHKTYHVNYLEEEDLAMQSVTFYLYDFDPQTIEKVGSLEYSIDDYQNNIPFRLPYDRPYIDNVSIAKSDPIQIVNGSDSYLIGFPQIGVNASATYHNPTSTSYAAGFFQLILRDNERIFEFDENKEIVERLKTIASTASLISGSKFWLDTYAPLYGILNEHSQFVLPPRDSVELKIIADDAPLYVLAEKKILPGNVIAHAKEYEAKSRFYVIVFAKPVQMEYFEGAWFPIKIFEWDWRARTYYDATQGLWEDNDENYDFNGLTGTKCFMPEWPDRAVSGEDYPDWREN